MSVRSECALRLFVAMQMDPKITEKADEIAFEAWKLADIFAAMEFVYDHNKSL